VPDAAWGCGWAWLWFWLFVILILFAGWGWGGWYGGWGGPRGWWPAREAPPQAAAPQPSQPGPANAPGEFLGKSLTVSGTVDQVFSPQAFTLAGARDLLVIDKNGKAGAVKKGEKVQITGKVERFEADQLRKETGVDLSKVSSADFTGRPAMVASAVSAQHS
jgi:hypothetical protein